MILSKEQRIGAAILFGIALVGWFIVAITPSDSASSETPKKKQKRPWAERRDSIRIADSLRFVQWKEEREQRYDSFRIADSLRHEAWKIERQHRWDSMRRADSLWRDSVGWRYVVRHEKRDTILDLNHCDTAELQLIRGIGRYTAMQIVRYREQLGGYYSLQQLTDEFFSKCRLDTLLAHFTVDTLALQKIPVNTSSVERLQRHPYLRYKQAKAIYTLRRQQVRLKRIQDLNTLPELTDQDIERIAPYLRFDE